MKLLFVLVQFSSRILLKLRFCFFSSKKKKNNDKKSHAWPPYGIKKKQKKINITTLSPVSVDFFFRFESQFGNFEFRTNNFAIWKCNRRRRKNRKWIWNLERCIFHMLVIWTSNWRSVRKLRLWNGFDVCEIPRYIIVFLLHFTKLIIVVDVLILWNPPFMV